MNKITEYLDYVVKQHSPKFVGKPTNSITFDFNFKQPELLKFERSGVTTINPIK